MHEAMIPVQIVSGVGDHEIGAQIRREASLIGAVRPPAVEMGEEATGAGEQDVEAPATGFVAEGLGEMRFPDAGGPLNQDVLVALDEAPGREVVDLRPRHRRIESKVEAFEGLLEIEARPPEADGELLLRPALDFILEEALEKVDMGERFIERLAMPKVEGLQDPGQAELLEGRDELVLEGHR